MDGFFDFQRNQPVDSALFKTPFPPVQASPLFFPKSAVPRLMIDADHRPSTPLSTDTDTVCRPPLSTRPSARLTLSEKTGGELEKESNKRLANLWSR
jgi:hypothetical protein